MKKILFILAGLFCVYTMQAQQNGLYLSKIGIAKDLVKPVASLAGVSLSDLDAMKVSSETFSNLSGVNNVYFQQTVNGIPVHNAILNVHVTKDNRLLTYGNRFVKVDDALRYGNTNPLLNPEQALNAALSALGIRQPGLLVKKESGSAPVYLTVFDKGLIALEDIKVQLVYQPIEEKIEKETKEKKIEKGQSLRLAWQVEIYTTDAKNWWLARIDAATGELLDKNNYVVSCDFGMASGELCEHDADEPHQKSSLLQYSFLNFTSINNTVGSNDYKVYAPPVESPNHTTPLPPADGRTLVSNPANLTASPFGWHDTNGAAGAEFTTTQGNNVHAYTDIDANNIPDVGSSPDGGVNLVFDFLIDLTQAPSTYRPAAVTNLFYWNNHLHDFAYTYGFNELSGNFQENNYGNGGLGSDYVQAEAQDGSGTNNANFGTPPDGSNPRMQMYIGTNVIPNVDGDLDNAVIAHEYAHGISNRLTGGPANTSCLGNAEQMGEGWSDFYGYMTTMKPTDVGTASRGIGTYLFGQPANGPGIRPTPYSTNMAVNPSTYNTIKTAAIPHGVGYVWASMLWDLNWKLIEVYGYTDGFNKTMQLINDGMKLQPCSPGFVDGRNAILAADQALYSGANQCLIWEVFARRGLGFSATQGSSSSTTDGVQAFNMPLSCIVQVTPQSASVCQPANAVFTVDNNTAISYTMTATGVPAGATVSFSPNPVPAGTSATMTIGNTGAAAAGTYIITVTATNGANIVNQNVTLIIQSGVPPAPTLLTPANAANNQVNPLLTWGAVAAAETYEVQVATDAGFTNIVASSTGLTNTNYQTTGLTNLTTYYWKVRGVNSCGNGNYAAAFSFTTANLICTNIVSTNVPVALPDVATATSTITVTGSGGTVAILKLKNLNITHTWIGDLKATLTSPTGTIISLFDRPGVPATSAGCSNDNIAVTFDDAAALTAANFENTCNATPPAISGTYQPINLFAGLAGETILGTWTLTIQDALAGDVGTLNSWELEICYIPACDIAVQAPTVTQPTCLTPSGTIAVNATGTGALEYSVDNGGTWQPTSTFSGLAPGNYNIVARVIGNPTCSSTYSGNPVVLIAAITPTVDAVANQSLCNNSSTIAVNFTGSAGASFNWINNMPSIGLAAGGTGNIASFTATNATNTPVTATVTVTPSTGSGGSAARILLLYADLTSPATLRTQLLALPGVTTVDFFDGGTGTPTLAQLQTYNIVVPLSNTSWANQVAIGDVLADYIDANGIVFAMNFDWFGFGQSITGRWLSGNYSPFNNPAIVNFSNGSLGVYTSGHPLMQGVSVLNAFYREIATLAAGATQVAAWNDNSPLLAVKGRAVAISAYLGDGPNNYSGDFAKLIVNAATSIGSPTCTGTSTSFTITVNPKPILRQTYNGVQVTANNDGVDDVGAFSVCNSTSDNVFLTEIADVFNIAPSNKIKVDQQVIKTNVNINTAVDGVYALSAIGPIPLGRTATLINAAISGTVVIKRRAFFDDNLNNIIDANECVGDWIVYTVTVNPLPAAPVVTSPVTYCLGATAVPLTATGTGLLWYNVASGGSGSGTAPTPSTAIAGTTSYWVSQTVNGCEGPRAQIDVVVNPLPAVEIASNSATEFCEGGSVGLYAFTQNYLKVLVPQLLTMPVGTAVFGAPISSTPVNGDFVYIADGTASYLGCSAYTAGSLTGKVALIDRGTCNFTVKVKNAQNAGAIGVIIVNNVAGGAINMGGVDPTITIPVVSVSQADGLILKNLITNGLVNGMCQDTHTYLWSTSATTSNITVTQAGNYTVTVTDANGCSATSAPVTITVYPPPVVTATATPPVICAGGTSNLNVTVQGAGNYGVTPIVFAPVAPTGPVTVLATAGVAVTPMTLNNLDDGTWDNIALPAGFAFNYYGTTPTTFSVSTNGFITFGASGGSFCCSGQLLPNAGSPNNYIAIAHEDWLLSSSGTLDYFVNGSAPFRKLVIRATAIPRFGGTGAPTTAMIVLNETVNTIEMHLTSVTSGPSDLTTQAIENATGSLYTVVPGRNRTVWSATNEGWLFAPITYSYAWNPPTGLSNTTISNPTATLNTTTSYTVVVTDLSTGCSTTSAPVTVTVNPIPNAVATPSTQTICTGNTITPVVLSGSVAGTVYSWTRDNLTVTGIAASGSGNISGSLTNATAAPVTVAFTITPSYTNAGVTCTGTAITATVVVNPVNTFTCPGNMNETITDVICFKAVLTPNPVFCGTLTKLTWKLTGATVLSSPTSGINYLGLRNMNVGVTTVTYTATAAGGITRTCSFTVTVRETIPPEIFCPLDIHVNTDPGKCYRTGPVNLGTPTTGDNCGVASVTNNAPAVYVKGVNFVTWTVTDKSGNTRTCVQRVTVNDVEKPILTCPANVNVNTGPVCAATPVSVPQPVFNDNCGIASLTWTMVGVTYGSSPSTGINFVPTMNYATGLSKITYTAVDLSGNAISCTFNVTVTDKTPPTLTCPPEQIFCKVANNTYTIPALIQSDNCVIVSTTFKITGVTNRTGTGTNASGTFNQGISTITWTVKDVNGNTSTCTTKVTVLPTSNSYCAPAPLVEPATVNPKFTEVEVPGLAITAWPNPSDNYFNLKVQSPVKEAIEIRVFDMAGKLVHTNRGAPGDRYILGSNLVTGMYIIEVRQAGKTVRTKVVKN